MSQSSNHQSYPLSCYWVCVCVCVCERSHARNFQLSMMCLLDQVSWSWMDLVSVFPQDYVHRKVDTCLEVCYSWSHCSFQLSVTVLFVASSSWCEVLTGIRTVPSQRDIHLAYICHRTIQILYYHTEGSSKSYMLNTAGADPGILKGGGT